MEDCQSCAQVLKEEQEFKQDEDHQRGFDRLKEASPSTLTLTLHEFAKSFVVIRNASGGAVGAILIQDIRTIAYISKKLKRVESNYPLHPKAEPSKIYTLQWATSS